MAADHDREDTPPCNFPVMPPPRDALSPGIPSCPAPCPSPVGSEPAASFPSSERHTTTRCDPT
ncbi:hypothetical protein T484DRAFT_1970699 [Baffinella frigidus]|nr:hypothetical protein T484DRAFT_1970699 [Cryptophyta sp. CCMP2293]